MKFLEIRFASVLPLVAMDARFGSYGLAIGSGIFAVDVDLALVSFLGKMLRKLRLALRRRVDVFFTSAVGAGGNATVRMSSCGGAAGRGGSTQPSGV